MSDMTPDVPRPLTGLRILVVEDDYMIASEVERLLRRAGAKVVGPWPGVKETLAGLDALTAQAGGALDAAVLDINLGWGETVYPVADRLDRLGVPYVFATGNTRNEDDGAYKDHLRLEKPISDRTLLMAVQALVRTRMPPA